MVAKSGAAAGSGTAVTISNPVTPFGEVRVKVGRYGGRDVSRSPEYEDCARLARSKDIPIARVYAAALGAARDTDS